MEARAAAFDHQILKPSKSVDEEAVMAARVHEHDLEVKNLRRRVASFRLTVFLGFPRGRPKSTSVVSVLTGESLMCTDLIGRDTDCLGLKNWTQQ